MRLTDWINWAQLPNDKKPSQSSWVLARQYARDAGVAVDHEGFIRAMLDAGYKVVRHFGSACFFNSEDSQEKRFYHRRKFLYCDDRLRHPLEDTVVQ